MSILSSLPNGLARLCEAGAAFGIGYNVLASSLLQPFFSRPVAAPTGYPAVTLLKPLCGQEWNLAENLESFFQHDYPGPVQFIFGVHSDSDPALKVVEQLRRAYPRADVTVAVEGRVYGPNRKISNLINMLAHARHAFLVFTDSDVAVDRRFLRNMVAELQMPEVGLVTCLYSGWPQSGIWSRLSAMATDYQFRPGAVTGVALGLAQPCFGQSFALRRSTLDEIGGLSQFVHHLAEDYALGQAVRRTGQEVAVPAFLVRHGCAETTLTKLFAHEVRWSRTVQTVDPVGHFGSVLAHPLPLALLAVVLSLGSPFALGLVAAALVARLGLKWRSDRLLGQPMRDFWLLPLCDLMGFAAFVASFFARRVIWRGHHFQVDRHGVMAGVGKPAS